MDKKRLTLEEFVDVLKKGPKTRGYDAILAYDRLRANRLLLQEYIDRYDSDRYFEPMNFPVPIIPGVQWEKVIDHLLDKPRLSFENSIITSSRADLTMRITGGKQLTIGTRGSAKGNKVSRVKIADELDGPALHMRIALDTSPGSVDKAGKVLIDLKKADEFYLSFADSDEENFNGGARYKKEFDAWTDEKKIFVLNELQMKDTDFLQPEKFWVRTDVAPLGRLRGSDEYGEGQILLFVTMKDSDNSNAGIPTEIEYLLPTAADPYTMNLLLGNKFLIERLVTQGMKNVEHLVPGFKVEYVGGGEHSFMTGLKVAEGKLNIPVKGASPRFNEIFFTEGLGLSLVGSAQDTFTRFEVRAIDEKLRFEWFGKNEAPVTLKPKDSSDVSGKVTYRWEYVAEYQFHVETTGADIGKLRLKPAGASTLRQRMAPDQDLLNTSADNLVDFIAFGEATVARHLAQAIETIVNVATDIDAFRLNGLLFRSGKEAAQPSTVRFPGDLTLPGYLSPARTQFEVVPSETVVLAASKKTFSITPASDTPVTWTVANVPGDEGENPGSIDPATGEYTAPPSSSVVRGNKKVIVTATRGESFAKALVSITLRSIAASPMVMEAAWNASYKLSAATLNAEPVTFSLPADAIGTLADDPEPDPSVQQGMLYVSPNRSLQDLPRKSEAWRRLRATAAWREEDDLAELLAIDTIDVSNPSNGGREQIPVLLPLENQLNWLTLHIEGEGDGKGVRLKFWGTNKSGDYEVAPEDTTWYLVLGNGTLDKETGVYTPIASDGNPLSDYAVIAAVEEDDRYWLWSYAIVPIPLVTPKLLVDSLNEDENGNPIPPVAGGEL